MSMKKMKTYRIQINDFDGCPAAIEVQGEHENHAVARVLSQIHRWGATDAPSLQIISVSETLPDDQDETEV
jgi:hypothetical protein